MPTRLADHGPVYIETQLDRFVVEPFNAVTAFLFLVLALCWLWRLRGRYGQNVFFVYCITLLAVGGVGGTLYHGTRSSSWFLVLDFLPIALICLSVAAYMWGRILKRGPVWGFGIVLAFYFPLALGRYFIPMPWAISFSYLVIGCVVVTPLAVIVSKTGYRQWQQVVGAFLLFLVALGFRVADSLPATARVLPMGSHWLWHLFSVAAVGLILEYFYAYTKASD
jgi:hypothetical protein